MSARICLVTEEMIPPFRRFCITQRSAEFLSSEFDVHLVYVKSPIEDYKSKGIHTHSVNLNWNQFDAKSRILAQFKLLRKTMKVCRRYKIDLVYGWWIPAFLASKITGKILISDMPEFGEEMYRTFFFPFKKVASNFLFRYQMLAAQYSKNIIVESEIAADIWEKRGIPKNKLFSIPYGIEVDFFAKTSSKGVRKKYGIPEDAILIVFHGDIGFDDGVDLLLKAIKDLDIWCLCAGWGSEKYMTYLKSIANKRTIFPGWIHYKEIPKIVKTSDIYVSPFRSTLYTNTTFPLKTMEAMAAGKPVICSRLKTLSTCMKDGYDIRFFKPNDLNDLKTVIKELIENESLRKRIGRNAKKTAIRKFDWRLRAHQELEIFRSAI